MTTIEQAEAAIQAAIEAERELWRNAAMWQFYADNPENKVRFFVLGAAKIEAFEKTVETFYGSLPSVYKLIMSQFDYKKFVG